MVARIAALSALVAGAYTTALPSLVEIREALGINITEIAELSRRAEAVNYNQDYIASGANVQYSPNQAAGTYTINYNTDADFVVGLGWQPGDDNPITYSGTFSATGIGILAIYGWSTNPLVEYYVMETSTGYSKTGTQKGTVTSDGGTYEVWEHQQVDQPSIQGTSTFNQYISIRDSPRTSGTVTIENHFNAWAGYGMNLGTLNYQVLAVESWSGSGSGSLSVSKGASTTTTSPGGGSTTTTSPGGGSTGTGGTGVAEYGQCGGIGFTGSTTCASPYVCTVLNSYYSQCQ
ncbi:endo-1,4-beta-xylanase B [Xylariaceae sp. FL0255]|nr:endo-1,4-beta-xylanase B [Xylariaceae sp. FL0255]